MDLKIILNKDYCLNFICITIKIDLFFSNK